MGIDILSQVHICLVAKDEDELLWQLTFIFVHYFLLIVPIQRKLFVV